MHICNYVDLIPLKNINDFDKNGDPLFSSSGVIRLFATAGISYESKVENTDNGRVKTETMSLKTSSSDFVHTPISDIPRRGIVKCHSDSGDFYIGTQEFPSIISYTTDKNTATIIAVAKTPVI